MPLSCETSRTRLASLHTLNQQLEEAVARVQQGGSDSDRLEARRLKQELEQGMDNLFHELNPFEELFNFEAQYNSQVKILEHTGILETLSNQEKGITSIPFFDEHGNPLPSKECPLPTQEQIIEWMRDNETIYKEKHSQGFTKMLIVPIGMSLDSLIEKYKTFLLSHKKNNLLLATKKTPEDPNILLDLSEPQPVFVSHSYKESDISNTTEKREKTDGMIYFPKQFDQTNHHGYTKQELLSNHSPHLQPLSSGWQILFIEDLPNLPRETQGKTIEKRPQIEANKTSIEYLAIQGTPPYDHEQGMTPESWLMYAITHLEETNQVIDDYGGSGSSCFLTGTYFPAHALVPSAFWYRGDRQADLERFGADDRWSDFGSRAVVWIYGSP